MLNRILIADDNANFRRLVRQFLALYKDFEICAEASSGLEAVELARAAHPDIALLDISMPSGNGIEACRRIRKSLPGTLLLAMSVYDPQMFMRDVIQAGFDGFVSKTSISRDLIPAIEA